MELTRIERWILGNQYRIRADLAKDPELRDSFARAAEALECGYQIKYSVLAEHVSQEELSRADSEFVLDVLDMFTALARAAKADALPVGVKASEVEFHGFDGNNEPELVEFARFWCQDPHGPRYTELWKPGFGFNAHMRTRDRYSRQLAEWQSSQDKHVLTASDVTRILDARTHPSRRES